MRKKYSFCFGVIYCTTNLINGKIYIGRSVFNNSMYLGSGVILKKAIKKYGKVNFKKKILCVCFNEKELYFAEEYLIKKYQSRNFKIGYNVSNGGKAGDGFKNKHHSEEAKRRMGSKGKKNGMFKKGYRIMGKNNPFYGKHHNEETLKKMKRPKTIEHKRKIGESKKGKPSPLKGTKCLKETKEKISRANKGKKHSEESRINMGNGHRGIKYKIIKVSCPFCGKVGGTASMHRWHFDNCKFKKGEINYEKLIDSHPLSLL